MNSRFFQEIHFFFIKKWYFDILYNSYVATYIYKAGSSLYALGDQGLLELFGPQGIFYQLSRVSYVKSLDTTIQYNLVLTVLSILMFFFFGVFL